MKKLIIKGVVDNTTSLSDLSLDKVDSSLNLIKKHSFIFASTRDEGVDITPKHIKDDDVMLLEFEDGIRLWIRVDQFEQDFPEAKTRDTDTGTLRIPKQLHIGDANRGISEWVLKSLNIFGIDPVSKTATSIANLVEKQLDQEPGIYQCVSDTASGNGDQYRLKLKLTTEKLDGSKPILLFLHGTASSSSGSFGELWNQSSTTHLNRLQEYFGKHIYAFEHRTLSESPIENTIDLLNALNKLTDQSRQPLQIHLVSHSRGGLVGELLARVDVDNSKGEQPISVEDIEQYGKRSKAHKKQALHLKKLNKLLDNKFTSGPCEGLRKFTIRRFVRTACPARGTTLASERLDRWLSITMNLIGQLPLLKVSPVYDAFSTFTLAVVTARTDPKDMPGLEAQMPGSPLVRLLNLTQTKVNADLSIISGDVEPDTFWGKLKFLMPDLYYRHDHDLIVDTVSMAGGTPRLANHTRTFFDQGPGVNHFQYFSNNKTATMLVNGLLREDDDLAGFTAITVEPRLLQLRSADIENNKPMVFLLPGILGSHLQDGNDRVWLDILDIAFGGMKQLKIDAENISAESLIGSAYANLVDYLEKDHEVFPFPYDWRLSIETEAARFSTDLESKLQIAERHNQPLHIIAHSMGGLVARMAFALKPDLWDRLVACTGRLLMLGTPLKGSHVIARALVGQEKLLKYLSLLDFAHNQKQLLQIISTFPGAIQLLPFQHGAMDLLDTLTWEKLAKADDNDWVKPNKKILQEAQNFWNKINQFKINHNHMLYVAGKAPATPVDIEIDASNNITFLATAKGDGRVTWESGIPTNIRSWFVNTSHGNLTDYKKAFPGFTDLLHHGDTNHSQLSIEPILARGETAHFFPMPLQDKIDILPDETMLIDSILGTQRSNIPSKSTAPLKVIMSHGDLCFASNSLALGHYHDDLIISAERFVNEMFDDRLRKRMLLGLYPGPLNTAQVIYNPKPLPAKPEAVLIIGLGIMGTLTRRTLTETFCHAALQYAISIVEKHTEADETTHCTNLKLSSLLIGTGAGGITIEDSLLAMIQGLNNANKQLQKMQCEGYQFVELEFLERWEDIANAAAHAMRIIGDVNDLAGQVVYDAALPHNNSQHKSGIRVNKIEGARSRVTYQEAEGWWRRLQIHHIEADDSLRFNTLTDKARAEITLQAIDLAQVDIFIKQSVASTYDHPELSKTLFEMLLPHSLKEQTQNQKDLVLVLNEKAARYPWELLQDRWANKNPSSSHQDNLPLSVEFGMIRQLESEVFRASSTMHSNNALVIGNPIGNTDFFPELAGAESEAKAIKRMLTSRNYKVKSILGKNSLTDAQDVILALHADSYRIIHFAGHGVYNYQQDDSKLCDMCGHHMPTTKKITGMVIGKDAFLTPANIKSIRFVPDLVFINCCHLGKEEGKKILENPHQLAANLATEFIRMGVKAVIATGWAVNDHGAETFASTFYNLMLEGCRFGDAVRRARYATYMQHKGSNTWGAYQCYGNPDFQLNLEASSGNNRQVEESVSESELAAKIEGISWDAKISRTNNTELLEKKLDKLVNSIPAEWMNHDVQEAIGRAYGELGALEQATEYYLVSLKKNSCNTSLKSIEQLANLQARLAVQRWQTPSAKRADTSTPLELVNHSIAMMEKLLAFGKTSERLSILASTYKRKAWISCKSARTDALQQMEDYYKQASELHSDDAYPLFNCLTAKIIVNWDKNKTDKVLQDQIQTLGVSKATYQQQTNFWKLVEYADYLLLTCLSNESLKNKTSIITDCYLQAKKRAGSPRQFSSVTEHIEFLVLMAESQISESKKKNNIVRGLKDILNTLTK